MFKSEQENKIYYKIVSLYKLYIYICALNSSSSSFTLSQQNKTNSCVYFSLLQLYTCGKRMHFLICSERERELRSAHLFVFCMCTSMKCSQSISIISLFFSIFFPHCHLLFLKEQIIYLFILL